MRMSQCLAAAALTFGLAISAHAGQIISISYDNDPAGPNASMLTSDLAGAPGVRVGNWNNFLDGTSPLGDNETVVYQDGSTVGGGFQVAVSIASGTMADRDNADLTNDREMFNGVIDVFTSATASVSNVPFALYDVYVYMRDDGPARAAAFTIGSQTFYVRGTGAGNPNTSGAGYIESTDTTFGLGTDIAQGNYAVFRGLTASSFDLIGAAVNAGDSVTRNKWPGFQIVAVPTPAALPAGLGLLGLAALRRRR